MSVVRRREGSGHDKPRAAAVLPDYGNEYRLPFKIVHELHDERGLSANIVRVDMASEYGMSKSFARCLQDYSVCIGCGRSPFPIEVHESCTRDSLRVEEMRVQALKLPEYRYRREFVTSYISLCQVLYADGKDLLIDAEMSLDFKRENKFLRKLRQPRIPRQLLMRLKHELLALHDGHCYYCFAVTEANADSADFDHFEPIAFGGTGDVWNLVFTCKQCNHDKGTAPGEVFRDAMFERADKTVRRTLKILHARVDAWREQKLQESLVSAAPLTSGHQSR